MAATLCPGKLTSIAAAITSPIRASQKRPNVNYISGLNSFGGLKAQNNVVALGLPVCTEQSFANFAYSLKHSNQRSGGGGALTSTCNAVAEIFRIAAVINGLTLVGVVIGFVLLRIEAAVEEAE
ncbi:hypothetical protein DCAR_0933377 [Daucus carota subsp. sativus]|uniref:Uncharacterized protein n=1 Tax=Daucus carota subsp. sativus TaxID=79200 RepID=A0A175YDA2_DAUCS|nr:PREDICTED: uncharacterized protein LOC108201004 [Daucus carota subsp. sativus]XP_017226490.1 PREDICTED: uncharacterized protein LOC108202551 [Daucus carota subsp. sativus]XP_017228052.1 PREDICTED: uncharacterized protein LOC108192675 [Daucus carota subsp. sativus]WOH13865.1 hypothetical protein DCAR_0933377 [Daucus carota subsp. sativus]